MKIKINDNRIMHAKLYFEVYYIADHRYSRVDIISLLGIFLDHDKARKIGSYNYIIYNKYNKYKNIYKHTSLTHFKQLFNLLDLVE